MPESSQTSGGEPFDVEEFARQTAELHEETGWIEQMLENRIISLEEIVAARRPRRWLLRRRLAREIRASVAGYTDDHIPRGDFRTRRVQAVSEQLHIEARERDRHWEEFRRQRDEAAQQDEA